LVRGDGVIVVADVSLWGFFRWAESRLRLLGIKVVYPPARASDYAIAELARRLNAVVVTSDKRFPYEPKAVLEFPVGKKPKYEKLYTQLMKKLHGGAMSNQPGALGSVAGIHGPPRGNRPIAHQERASNPRFGAGLVVKIHEPRSR